MRGRSKKLTEFINGIGCTRRECGGKFGSVFIRMKSSGRFSNPLALYGATQIGGVIMKEVGGTRRCASILGPKCIRPPPHKPRATEYMIQGLRYSSTDMFTGPYALPANSCVSTRVRTSRRTGLSMKGGSRWRPNHPHCRNCEKGVMETIPSIFGNQQ